MNSHLNKPEGLNYYHGQFTHMMPMDSIFLTVYDEAHKIQNIVIISAKDCDEPIPARDFMGFHYPISAEVLEDIIIEPKWTIEAHNYNQAEMLIKFNNSRIEQAMEENSYLQKFI